MRFNAVSVASLGVLAVLAPMSVKASQHDGEVHQVETEESPLMALFNKGSYIEFASAFVNAVKSNQAISAEEKQAWKVFGGKLNEAIASMEGKDEEESDVGDNDSLADIPKRTTSADAENQEGEEDGDYFVEEEDEEDAELTAVEKIDRRLKANNILGAISLFQKYSDDETVTGHPAMVGHMTMLTNQYYAEQEAMESGSVEEPFVQTNEEFVEEGEEIDGEQVEEVSSGQEESVEEVDPRAALKAELSISKPGAAWDELTNVEKVRAFWTASNWSDVILQFEAAREECEQDALAVKAYADAKLQLGQA